MINLIDKLKKEIHDSRSDSFVSMAEGVCNEIWVDKLEKMLEETNVEPIKRAVEYWRYDFGEHCRPPSYIHYLCHIIFKLKNEVFNFDTGIWEYEGLDKKEQES